MAGPAAAHDGRAAAPTSGPMDFKRLGQAAAAG